MGKINYGRVILGGIVGGIIAGFLDWFFNGVLMGQQWEDAMKSLNRPAAFSGAFLFCLFLVYTVGGILLVWMYAAIRPRLGAGVRTAVCAGLFVWAFAFLLPGAMNWITGLYNTRLSIYSTVAGLVELLILAIIGCALYKEAESTAADYRPASEAHHATH